MTTAQILGDFSDRMLRQQPKRLAEMADWIALQVLQGAERPVVIVHGEFRDAFAKVPGAVVCTHTDLPLIWRPGLGPVHLIGGTDQEIHAVNTFLAAVSHH